MTFKQLIHQITWTELEYEIVEIYPDERDLLTYYKKLFWTLCNLEADENKIGAELVLDLISEEEIREYEDDDDLYFEQDFSLDELSEEDWKRYLGYYIPDDLLMEFPVATIIVHVLMEAVYGGLDNDFLE